MLSQIIRPAAVFMVVMTVLTGVVYPFLVTLVAQVVFHQQANGSLLYKGDKTPGSVGSALIGQPFDDPKYFWSRPSATGPFAYNAAASSGSNLGPIEPNLLSAFQSRIDALKQADPDNRAPIPVDLVTASASGLDPHISPAAAAYQVGRVARMRGIEREKVEQLVTEHTEGRTFELLGERRVNVLELNLALDGITPARRVAVSSTR